MTREFGKAAAGELGKKSGGAIWWLVAFIAATVLGLIPQTRNAAIAFIRHTIQSVTQPDTSRTK